MINRRTLIKTALVGLGISPILGRGAEADIQSEKGIIKYSSDFDQTEEIDFESLSEEQLKEKLFSTTWQESNNIQFALPNQRKKWWFCYSGMGMDAENIGESPYYIIVGSNRIMGMPTEDFFSAGEYFEEKLYNCYLIRRCNLGEGWVEISSEEDPKGTKRINMSHIEMRLSPDFLLIQREGKYKSTSTLLRFG